MECIQNLQIWSIFGPNLKYPKFLVSGPTLTPICPLKMDKIKKSHQVIQINQNQDPISFQFSIKAVITFSSLWAFLGTNEPSVKDQEATA